MRASMLSALVLLAVPAMAPAQPVSEHPPTWTIQCIDVSGEAIPARCSVPASRLDRSEFLCTCPAGGMRTRVAICGPGQSPPPENVALNRVRRQAARGGSLEGATIDGRPICVAPRRP